MNKILLGRHNNFSIYWDTTASQNKHTLITGKSGTGKTTALIHLAQMLHKNFETFYVLDYANCFPSHISVSEHNILQHPSILNPFSNHLLDSNAVHVLIRYADMLANLFKLGTRQKPLLTRALLEMNLMTATTPISSTNPFHSFLTFDGNIIRKDFALLAYCLAAHDTKEDYALANRFLDLILLAKSLPETKYPSRIAMDGMPANLTILRFPPVGPSINAQLTDLFLWYVWYSANEQDSPSPVTIICDEAKLLNWNKLGIVRKILNEGRQHKINLFLAMQSLTDELAKTALSSIMQPDLHLAFTPPDTDCRSIAKLIFDETSETLFSDWVKHWLDMKKGIVEQSTYEGYLLNAKHIIEYFSDKKLRLVDLKPLHFEEYYHLMLTEGKTNPRTGEHSGLAIRTVRSHKFIINSALNDAVLHEIIQRNPAANLTVTNKRKKDLAKKIVFFSLEEANTFLDFVYQKEDILADIIYITLYLGLRRSEVLGLTEDSIDFKRHLLYINRTVVKVQTQYTKNRTKTPTSDSAFYLTPELEDFFKSVLAKKQDNQAYYGNTYQREKELFVWDDGRPIAPDYVYHHFKKLVTEFGRPDMTFHALRHSTASILAAKGWHPREIQEWLRHADFYTTMNIYTHLDSKALIERSERLAGVLNTRVG